MGYLPADFPQVRPEKGRQARVVVIDRASQVAFAERRPYAKQLKSLRGPAPHEFDYAQWQKNLVNFT